MGLLKSIFGAGSKQDDAVAAMLDQVDPETGFTQRKAPGTCSGVKGARAEIMCRIFV